MENVIFSPPLCGLEFMYLSWILCAVGAQSEWRPQAPIWKYLIVSLSNVYASSCQYEALKLGGDFRSMFSHNLPSTGNFMIPASNSSWLWFGDVLSNNPPRKYVSFAVQMLGKSFKMMPVMIWGMIISGKSYSILGLFRCCFLLI